MSAKELINTSILLLTCLSLLFIRIKEHDTKTQIISLKNKIVEIQKENDELKYIIDNEM